MVQFLSAEWMDEARAAAAASDATSATGPAFVLQQRVTGAPGGDVGYWTRIGEGAITVGPGESPDAVVTITSDYALASALSRGEVSPPQAMMSGRAEVSGDMVGLMRRQKALAALDGALKKIPTEY